VGSSGLKKRLFSAFFLFKAFKRLRAFKSD
jgi:hypothetical protein